MRIEGDVAGVAISEAWIQLTREDAEALHLVLSFMLSDEAEVNDDWHAHVTATDGSAELTLGWDLR